MHFVVAEDAAVILEGLVQNGEDPWGIVERIMAAVPVGSYLAISHPALEIHPGQE